MRVSVLYFARLRESLGLAQETLELPDGVSDIAGLMAWLAGRGEPWRQEFAGCRPVRAALNQTLAANSASLAEGDEVAFFPPVTGG